MLARPLKGAQPKHVEIVHICGQDNKPYCDKPHFTKREYISSWSGILQHRCKSAMLAKICPDCNWLLERECDQDYILWRLATL